MRKSKHDMLVEENKSLRAEIASLKERMSTMESFVKILAEIKSTIHYYQPPQQITIPPQESWYNEPLEFKCICKNTITGETW